MDKIEAATLIITKMIEQDQYDFSQGLKANLDMVCAAYKAIYSAIDQAQHPRTT